MNETTGFGGWIAVIALIVILLFGGRLFNGGDAHISEIVNGAINNQSTQNGIRDVLLSSANNNYETAQLINGQTNTLIEQNNANLINAIQGFNQINLSIQNQTNVLSQQLAGLQAKMDTCCCEIKTQMLQDRLTDAQAALVAKTAEISNYNQSQYLLGQMGKWVANAPAT